MRRHIFLTLAVGFFCALGRAQDSRPSNENYVHVWENDDGSIQVVSSNIPELEPYVGRPARLPATDVMTLLRREDIRREVEIIDIQVQKLDELQRTVEQAKRELAARLDGQPKFIGEFKEATARLKDMQNEAIDKILLPHQSKRLGQIQNQLVLRQKGVLALNMKGFADKLKITEEQKEKIVAKQQEVVEELQKKFRELQLELDRDVRYQILTPEQRRTFDDLVGRPLSERKP